jgi:hypothetical protein
MSPHPLPLHLLYCCTHLSCCVAGRLIDLRLKMIWGSINEQSRQVKIYSRIRGFLPHPSTACIRDVAPPNAMRYWWHLPELLCSPALQYGADRPASEDDLGQYQ